MSLVSFMMLLAASLAAAAGQLLLKVGAQHKTHLAEFINAAIAAGLLLYLCGTVLWIYVLSKEKLVVVYAFTALTFARSVGLPVPDPLTITASANPR